MNAIGQFSVSSSESIDRDAVRYLVHPAFWNSETQCIYSLYAEFVGSLAEMSPFEYPWSAIVAGCLMLPLPLDGTRIQVLVCSQCTMVYQDLFERVVIGKSVPFQLLGECDQELVTTFEGFYRTAHELLLPIFSAVPGRISLQVMKHEVCVPRPFSDKRGVWYIQQLIQQWRESHLEQRDADTQFQAGLSEAFGKRLITYADFRYFHEEDSLDHRIASWSVHHLIRLSGYQ